MALIVLHSPAYAGDLGFYDEWLPGMHMSTANNSQRVFDIGLGSVTFTPERLFFIIQPQRRDAKAILKGRFEKYLNTKEQGYIMPWQVTSYSTFFSGGGMFFQILYTSRSGHKSVATIGFANANTATSFHQVFLDWWNGRLVDSISPQKMPVK